MLDSVGFVLGTITQYNELYDVFVSTLLEISKHTKDFRNIQEISKVFLGYN